MRTMAFVLLALGLAGCVEDDGPESTARIVIDGQGQVINREALLSFDGTDRPAAELYGLHDATHPDFYNAVDLLEQWREATGTNVGYDHHETFGFNLQSIAGVKGNFTNGFWWGVLVDGLDSCVGMDGIEVTDGMRVEFRLHPASYGGDFSHC